MAEQRARRTHRGLVVAGLVLALAMAALEATVVATAMPTVIADLGGIQFFAWVTTAYLLTSSVTVPIYGKLADLYGRKPVMLAGIALFLAGSMWSGAAHSMVTLILARALQGLGAGSMQPMAITIVGDIFDLEERSRMQGLFGSIWGIFGLLGPQFGGFVVQHFSWRWVFYFNLPFGIAAALLVGTFLHERVERKAPRLDVSGALLLAAAVTALLIAASHFGPSATIVAGAVAPVLLSLFLWVERRAPEPLLPLPLFRRRVIWVGSLVGAIIGGAMVGTTTFIPLFIQGVQGGTPTQAGSAITPMLVAWPIASTVAGRLVPRIGFRSLVRGGIACTAVAALALALVAAEGAWPVRLACAAFGVGMGLSNTALMIAVQTSVSFEQRGTATASSMFSRTIGGALAVGVMGGVLAVALSADPAIPPDAISKVLSPEGLRSLDPETLRHLSTALKHGLGQVFWIIAGMAFVALSATLFFPSLPIEGARARAAPPAH